MNIFGSTLDRCATVWKVIGHPYIGHMFTIHDMLDQGLNSR